MPIRWKTALSVLGIACMAWVAPSGAGASGAWDPDAEEFVEQELIVSLAAGPEVPTPEQVVESARRRRELPGGLGVGSPERVDFLLRERAQGRFRERLLAEPDSPRARLERTLVLRYPAVVNLAAIEAALENNPHVLSVERNRIYPLAVTPLDSYFPATASPYDHQWGSHLLKLPEAWDHAKGQAYVGIIDTGIDTDHEDLQAFTTQSGTVVYTGGNFRPHLSYDYTYNDANVDEGEPQIQDGEPRTVTAGGHGTHVAGIVGATANNGRGVAGACWACSLMIARANRLQKDFLTGQYVQGGLPEASVVAALTTLTDKGAQLINMSFGRQTFIPDCNSPTPGNYCNALAYAHQRDLILVAASGNDGVNAVDFPARHPDVIAAGGIIPGGGFWNACDAGLDTADCPSNYGSDQELVAPARQVLSTFYLGLPYAGTGCDDGVGAGGPGYGPCSGTSMSSPYVVGSAAVVRSVNPLLTESNVRDLFARKASNNGTRDFVTGYGAPNVLASVQGALGKAANVVIPNRLTPLFSLYNSSAQDFFYTTVPQMATAALFDSVAPYSPSGPSVPGYPEYPGGECQVGPCLPTQPTASAYIFTTDKAFPGTLPLVPLYRMSNRSVTTSPNWDTTYTTEAAGILRFRDFDGNGTVDYELDGIEGYIYQRCTPEPTCIPTGAVRLYRLYNASRKDWAIFPESELPQMQAAGYAPVSGFNDWIGYVYRNVDSDGDNVINDFEGLLGTDPSRSDSDCDGLSDGTEILAYPYDNKDPLGPDCRRPVARFTFSCSGLFCSFDASGSTDNLGIVSYSWTFGDSTSGSGVTTSHSFGARGSYTVILTVTDGHGLQSSLSRKVSVTDEAPVAAEGFFTVPPCRIADTRSTTPLTSGVLRGFQITGLCAIPATARAVSVNLTVVSPTGAGHLVFFPGNQSSGPFAHASINFDPPNSARANNGILRLGGAGSVTVAPAVQGTPGEVHLILDVYGYFSEDAAPAPGAQGPLGFQTVTPCRIGDTRTSGTPIAVNTTRNFTVQGVCGVPAGAAAAVLNPVVLGPTAGGHATLFQAGAFPPVPTINFNAGVVLANGARSRLASTVPDISFNYFSPVAGASTHALIDVYGYFKTDGPLRYRPITPCRAVDTRFADQGAPALQAPGLRTFQIRGNCGVPATAKAAAVNLTTVGSAGPGHLVVYPSGGGPPAASYLNFDPSQGALGNGGIVALSNLPDDLAVASANSTHLIIDVFGYFE